MKLAKIEDYSQNLIEIRNLASKLEIDFNHYRYAECLEKATELCIKAREMKAILHSMTKPRLHIVKEE
jgi:hypothetical protein